MLVNILSLIHNTTTLLFGVYASAAFLGIRMNRKNILALLTFSCITGVFYVLFFVLHGTSFTEQVYPFIIHIPLVLFLTFYYKYKMANSILAVLTAYLCCQISNWTGIAAMTLTSQEWIYYSVRICVTIIVFILPPGGFFVFGMLIALAGKLSGNKKKPEEIGCAACPMSGTCPKLQEKGACDK